MPLTDNQRGIVRSIVSGNRKPFERNPTHVCRDRNAMPVCDPDQATWVNGFLVDLVDFDPDDFDLYRS